MSLPGSSVEELQEHLTITDRGSLTEFLAVFAIHMPVICGDLEAIERVAYEFCEDCSNDNIIYCEARYCPHLLANDMENPFYADTKGNVSPLEVVKAVNRGLKKGCVDFNIKVKTILCCMRERPEWAQEILDLCLKFKDQGVVAIDLAGDENLDLKDIKSHDEHLRVFQEAEWLGLSRTVHAGENGPAEIVREAVYDMHAQRLGHGYHVLDDETLYKAVREKGVHFEACPVSSHMTGSVSTDWTKHPILRFARDGVNFSVNTDDPLLIGGFLSSEYETCTEKIGLSLEQIRNANLNAARATFLPEDEKQSLLKQLQEDYEKSDSSQGD
ncbi:adenosine deaminase-like isoform X2 [Lingula anatina]|nr:adenosine deaminase-like isoform X2 [Lingula anatina]|eukprot:XP_023930667.1 adenosine deaminase-like isoform X2 [Lingula anatina]